MFALILTVCSFAACNSYYVATDDSWYSVKDCKPALIKARDKILDKGLEAYLIPLDLQHEAAFNDSWALSCETIPAELIP